MAIYIGDGDNNVWNGTEEDDTAYAQGGNDILHGLSGADYLYGRDGDDELYGDNGNDVLFGGAGNDLLDGGEGDDILTIFQTEEPMGVSAGDRFVGGSGYDTLSFVSSDFNIYDIRSASVAADIEAIRTTSCFVQLTRAQFLQFQKYEGNFYLTGSGTFDLTGGQFLGGLLRLDGGDDILTLTGVQVGANKNIAIFAGDGNDQVTGSEGVDLVTGGTGNDRLEGRGGNDSLQGEDGNDVLIGGEGNDDLWGDGGVDSYEGGGGDDIVHLDFNSGPVAGESMSGGSGTDSIWILGTGTLDLESGLIADDFERLSSQSLSHVRISTARLGHFLSFDANELTLTTAGAITMSENLKARYVNCSDAGNNVDFSQLANGIGGGGFGGAGADTLTGSIYGDGLRGNGGNDILHGGGGNDDLGGGNGLDWVDGGAGDDRITIALGEVITAGDRFTGGADRDTLFLEGQNPGSGQTVVIDFSGATIDSDIEVIDSIFVGAKLTTANAVQFSRIHLATLELTTGGAIDFAGKDMSLSSLYLSAAGNTVRLAGQGVYGVFGGAGDDIVYMGDVAVPLEGRGGNDTLYGGTGGDNLNGGEGLDRMEGGLGNDFYYVDRGDDVVVELANGGNDRIVTTANYRLAEDTYVETLETWNVGTAFRLDGNSRANTIIGNDSSNFLDGNGGGDVLWGGGGNDTCIVWDASDVINEAFGQGFDAAYCFVSFALTNVAEVEWLSTIDNSATNAINLTGSMIGQYLIGNNGANVLDGKAGADFMQGFGGDDTYYIDTGGDAPVEAAGGGFDTVYTLLSYGLANGTEIEWLATTSSTGTAAINLLGNNFAQTLQGNAGNNALDGAGGPDAMYGGLGNDTYIVDQAGDRAIEAAGEGFDAVYTTSSFALSAGSEVEWISAAAVGSTAALNLGGNEYNNYVLGNNGANVIDGGGGLDILYGYGGADSFQFTTALGANNVDTITDFVAGLDKIALDDAIFTAIGAPGALAATAFVNGTAALDADDRIVYNAATGQLFYDADGNGAGAAILFATLQGNPFLTAADVQVI